MRQWFAILSGCFASVVVLVAQPYGEPDRGQPGDVMIQGYLEQQTRKVEEGFPGALRSLEEWQAMRPRWVEEFYDMLGLGPVPEKSPLQATVTGVLEGDGFVVEMLHYQSRPGLYVTANLYRPVHVEPGSRLPAILYVCGHSPRGRDGNKTAFQSYGIWFARHGYVCLVVDTLQLGEIPGIHHGTYREGRWWWLSRGYTPAGVEAWNGIRGLDYLAARPDVDPDRMGLTGISGGGAASFWIGAADERAQVVVPVSGLADLGSYVTNRVINGHCDCMFMYNTYQWPWTRLAALVAPRPLLFMNSDRDPIFPMDANDRVINRLERVYSWYGKGDLVDSFVSLGGHDYRADLRQGAYRFLNLHLRGVPGPVTDSEVDLVTGSGDDEHPLRPADLRVFPSDADLPTDALNGTIDETFVPLGQPGLPPAGGFEVWRDGLMADLRRLTFRHFPERIPAASLVEDGDGGVDWVSTEPGIQVRMRTLRTRPGGMDRVMLCVTGSDARDALPDWLEAQIGEQDAVHVVEPRGVGGTRWTTQNPPNYVERAHYLLGRTVDSGRVWDIAAAVGNLRQRYGTAVPVWLAGEGASGVLAAYAALLQPDVTGLALNGLPTSHMSESAPALLNVLRVCDIPEAIGMLAPRPVILTGAPAEMVDRIRSIYRSADALDGLTAVIEGG